VSVDRPGMAVASFYVQHEDWEEDAACKGKPTEWFYVGKGESPWRGLQVCAGCPVRRECLDYSLRTHDKNGIWGGYTPRQRRSIKRVRRGLQEAS